MPEIRLNVVTREWVIMATERAKRPSDYRNNKERRHLPHHMPTCPFCPGNERKTPAELARVPDGENWKIRVVTNKFAALTPDGEKTRREDGGLARMVSGVGRHEVIIETPAHDLTTGLLGTGQIEDVLRTYRARFINAHNDPRVEHAIIFKNHGEAAGATLEHSHSQLIALPIIPKRVSEELDGALEYYNFKERCVFCDIIRQEVMQGVRVVSENRDFIAITPYAPKSPFEIWILPKVHEANFENAQKHHYESLSMIFSDVLRRMDKVLNFPPYNFILHAAPIRDGASQFYHWHFELIPKLTKTAGFEWGSGFYINPTPPEEAAKFLREAKV